MASWLVVPAGERIRCTDGKLEVPEQPIIPFIEGDETGPPHWGWTGDLLLYAVFYWTTKHGLRVAVHRQS